MDFPRPERPPQQVQPSSSGVLRNRPFFQNRLHNLSQTPITFKEYRIYNLILSERGKKIQRQANGTKNLLISDMMGVSKALDDSQIREGN